MRSIAYRRHVTHLVAHTMAVALPKRRRGREDLSSRPLDEPRDVYAQAPRLLPRRRRTCP